MRRAKKIFFEFLVTLLLSGSFSSISQAIMTKHMVTSFGTNPSAAPGVATVDLSDPMTVSWSDESGRKITRDPDGKIVVMGHWAYNSYSKTTKKTTYYYYPAAVRFNTDGTLDTTFNHTGYSMMTSLGNVYVEHATVYQDGSRKGDIIFSGAAVYDSITDTAKWDGFIGRIKSDGTFASSSTVNYGGNDDIIDTVFDSSGNIYALVEARTGAIDWYNLASGRSYNIVKMSTSGSSSTLITNLLFSSSGTTEIMGIKMNNDKIIVAGRIDNSTGDDFPAVARYNLDGSLDTTFNGGIILGSNSGFDYIERGAFTVTNSKVLIAGHATNPTTYEQSLTLNCFDDAGSCGGVSLPQISGFSTGLTIDPQGKIVLIGYIAGGEEWDPWVARLNTDNQSLDESFGYQGIVWNDPYYIGDDDFALYSTNPNDSTVWVEAKFSTTEVWTESDGSIITGGNVEDTHNNYMGVIKLKGYDDTTSGGCQSDAECDDGNPCTQDACSLNEKVSECVHMAVAAGTSCDDGDACNGISTCQYQDEKQQTSACIPGSPSVTDDGHACTTDSCDPATGNITHTSLDNDGDGYDACHDCNDNNPQINPGANDVCDGQDNDCDGRVDISANGTDANVACSSVCGPGKQTCVNGVLQACDSVATDSDGDGTADCLDNCPNDPLKTSPGACGCGIADVDSDHDGIMDCQDSCIAEKTETCDGKDNNCDGTVDEGNVCGTPSGCQSDADCPDDGDPCTTAACAPVTGSIYGNCVQNTIANCNTNQPTAICGNGIVDAGEECDDGNNTNNDGCNGDCTFSCVDGVSQNCDNKAGCDPNDLAKYPGCLPENDNSDGTTWTGNQSCQNGQWGYCVRPTEQPQNTYSCLDGTTPFKTGCVLSRNPSAAEQISCYSNTTATKAFGLKGYDAPTAIFAGNSGQAMAWSSGQEVYYLSNTTASQTATTASTAMAVVLNNTSLEPQKLPQTFDSNVLDLVKLDDANGENGKLLILTANTLYSYQKSSDGSLIYKQEMTGLSNAQKVTAFGTQVFILDTNGLLKHVVLEGTTNILPTGFPETVDVKTFLANSGITLTATDMGIIAQSGSTGGTYHDLLFIMNGNSDGNRIFALDMSNGNMGIVAKLGLTDPIYGVVYKQETKQLVVTAGNSIWMTTLSTSLSIDNVQKIGADSFQAVVDNQLDQPGDLTKGFLYCPTPAATGCQTDADCVDDGDACTAEVCNPVTGSIYGTCSSNTIANCNTNQPPNCDDGDACTTDELVTTNTLTGTTYSCTYTQVNVDDNDSCTNDSCDPATGISHIEVPVDDGHACTTDSCSNGNPIHTPISGCCESNAECGDGNACTDDICTLVTGYAYTTCTHSNIPVEDDNNACTTDSCDPATGQVHTTIPVENDNNACTTDSCDPATGQVHTTINCDDGNACTTDSCNTQTGSCEYSTSVAVNCQPATPSCGNGVTETGETCDDGNTADNDGCSANCQTEEEKCTDGQSFHDVLCMQKNDTTNHQYQTVCLDKDGVEWNRVDSYNKQPMVGQARDPDGNLYYTDTTGKLLYQISRMTQETSIKADLSSFFTDGEMTDGMADANGNIYVASKTKGVVAHFVDGTLAWQQTASQPDNLVLDSSNNVYFTALDNNGNPALYKIDTTGALTSFITAQQITDANGGQTITIADMMKSDTDSYVVAGINGEIFKATPVSAQTTKTNSTNTIVKMYGSNLPITISGIAGKYNILYASNESGNVVNQYPRNNISAGTKFADGSYSEMNWTQWCPGNKISQPGCTPTTEVCDGVDNDCDGQVDEELIQDCSTDCGTGTQTCTSGTWGDCSAPTTCGTTAIKDQPVEVQNTDIPETGGTIEGAATTDGGSPITDAAPTTTTTDQCLTIPGAEVVELDVAEIPIETLWIVRNGGTATITDKNGVQWTMTAIVEKDWSDATITYEQADNMEGETNVAAASTSACQKPTGLKATTLEMRSGAGCALSPEKNASTTNNAPLFIIASWLVLVLTFRRVRN